MKLLKQNPSFIKQKTQLKLLQRRAFLRNTSSFVLVIFQRLNFCIKHLQSVNEFLFKRNSVGGTEIMFQCVLSLVSYTFLLPIIHDDNIKVNSENKNKTSNENLYNLIFYLPRCILSHIKWSNTRGVDGEYFCSLNDCSFKLRYYSLIYVSYICILVIMLIGYSVEP